MPILACLSRRTNGLPTLGTEQRVSLAGVLGEGLVYACLSGSAALRALDRGVVVLDCARQQPQMNNHATFDVDKVNDLTHGEILTVAEREHGIGSDL
jgi:hypothetical protein